jgi:hypothetical protein
LKQNQVLFLIILLTFIFVSPVNNVLSFKFSNQSQDSDYFHQISLGSNISKEFSKSKFSLNNDSFNTVLNNSESFFSPEYYLFHGDSIWIDFVIKPLDNLESSVDIIVIGPSNQFILASQVQHYFNWRFALPSWEIEGNYQIKLFNSGNISVEQDSIGIFGTFSYSNVIPATEHFDMFINNGNALFSHEYNLSAGDLIWVNFSLDEIDNENTGVDVIIHTPTSSIMTESQVRVNHEWRFAINDHGYHFFELNYSQLEPQSDLIRLFGEFRFYKNTLPEGEILTPQNEDIAENVFISWDISDFDDNPLRYALVYQEGWVSDITIQKIYYLNDVDISIKFSDDLIITAPTITSTFILWDTGFNNIPSGHYTIILIALDYDNYPNFTYYTYSLFTRFIVVNNSISDSNLEYNTVGAILDNSIESLDIFDNFVPFLTLTLMLIGIILVGIIGMISVFLLRNKHSRYNTPSYYHNNKRNLTNSRNIDIIHKQAKYCSECGQKFIQGDKFCANCGNKLES